MLVLVDGARSARLAEFARVCDMFDGNDEAAVAAARERWRAAKAAGHALIYWQQTEAGWEKRERELKAVGAAGYNRAAHAPAKEFQRRWPSERTLSIIKPDATRRNLTGKINARFEERGLRIVAQKRLQLDARRRPSSSMPCTRSGRSSATSSRS